MANRMKEDERIEKTIRSLLKLPENRRCINCNSLGPQYVCTTFWTFVCTNCSGVHREFTHRVKSVSMAKFTAEEANAIQAGGNERARQIYLKEWDPQRHSFPDGSNLHKLRDFIKHVYVDRKYSGENSMDKLPRLKLSDREDPNRKADVRERRYSERSSPGRRSEDRGFKYYYDERRSPRYAQENNRSGGCKRSPVRFEVVDDRFRDDGGSGRRFNTRRFSSMESVPGIRSPDLQKNIARSKSPVVRPVSDILGESIGPLQVAGRKKANEGRDADGSAHNQKILSTSEVQSADGNLEPRGLSSGSLIDLSTDPEPPDAVPVPQTQQVPSSLDADSQVTSASSEKEKAHPNENTLELLLSQLMVPPPVTACNLHEGFSSGTAPATAPVGNMLMLPAGGISPAEQAEDMPTLPGGAGASTINPSTNVAMPPLSECAPAAVSTTYPPTNFPMPSSSESGPAAALAVNPSSDAPLPPSNGSVPAAASTTNQPNSPNPPPKGVAAATAQSGMTPASLNNTGNSFVQVTDGQLPIVQQNQLSSTLVDGNSTAQQTSPAVQASDNQPWPSPLTSNADGPASASAEQSLQAVSRPAQDTSSGDGLQSVEVKPSIRKELPVDLFSANFAAVPVGVPGWQSVPHHFTGFSMQYHPATPPVPGFRSPTNSTNPFDMNSGNLQPTMFPSMSSLQGALPNVSDPTSLLRTSSLGIPATQFTLPQSPTRSSSMPPQPPYASTMSPGAPMGQQTPSNMPPPGQHYGSAGSGESDFSSLYTHQQSSDRYSGATTPNSFPSRGGNPFE